MDQSLNAGAYLDSDEPLGDDTGVRPASPAVIAAPVAGTTEPEDVTPAQDPDVEIVASFEALKNGLEIIASLESLGGINRSMASEIKERYPDAKLAPIAYFTDAVTATQYRASLEALTYSLEGRIANAFMNTFKNATDTFSRVGNRFKNASNSLNKFLANAKESGLTFSETEIENANFVSVLSPTGKSLSVVGYFQATQDLLDYAEGAIKQLNAKSGLLKELSEGKQTDITVETFYKLMATLPKANTYGRNNQWSAGKDKNVQLSSPLAGKLRFSYVTLDAEPLKTIQSFKVTNGFETMAKDKAFSVPGSDDLLPYLEKLSTRLSKIANEAKAARQNAISSRKLEGSSDQAFFSGNKLLNQLLASTLINNYNVLFAETRLVSKAIEQAINVWGKVTATAMKSGKQASTESFAPSVETFGMSPIFDVSQEGVFRDISVGFANINLEGIKSVIDMVQRSAAKLRKGSDEFSAHIKKLQANKVTFDSQEVKNKDVIGALSPTGKALKESELFSATLSLVDYLQGALNRVKQKREMVSAIIDGKHFTREEVLEVFAALPNASFYGSKNKWNESGNHTFSIDLPGKLLVRYHTSNSKEFNISAVAYTVVNAAKVKESDDALEIPKSAKLLPFLVKLSETASELAQEIEKERKAIDFKLVALIKSSKNILKGKFSAIHYVHNIAYNYHNHFYAELSMCTTALSRVLTAWSVALNKVTPKDVSTESFSTPF